MLEPERRSRVGDDKKTGYRPAVGAQIFYFWTHDHQIVSIFTAVGENRTHFVMFLNQYTELPSNDTSSGK